MGKNPGKWLKLFRKNPPKFINDLKWPTKQQLKANFLQKGGNPKSLVYKGLYFLPTKHDN